MAIKGTRHDDNLTGTSGNDVFVMIQGGNDTVSGGDGNDKFRFGDALTAADSIDGGTGKDTVFLDGDYSAGLVFGAATIQNVEVLRLSGGHSYNLTLNDGNVAAHQTLTINARALHGTDQLIFDGSAEQDGRFVVYGGTGDDQITGGAKSDKIYINTGGDDTVHAGGGDDKILADGKLTASDKIDGGAGSDTLYLFGTYAGLTLGADTITNIEKIKLTGAFSYALTSNDANVAAGQTLTVDASALSGAQSALFDGSAETDGAFHFIGGAGINVFAGGKGADIFDLANGAQSNVTGGDGNDQFNLGGNFGAGSSIDGGTGSDTLTLSGDYSDSVHALTDAMLSNVETLVLADGNSYGFASADGVVASGATLTVTSQVSGLGLAYFDGSAETDGNFIFNAGTGHNLFNGGANGDVFNWLQASGVEAHGGGGDDAFSIVGVGAANLRATDIIDGGSGSDTVTIFGNLGSAGTPLAFTNTTLQNVETLQLLSGADYIATADGNVAAGKTLAVSFGFGSSGVFDGQAETDGAFTFSLAGTTTVYGGAKDDTFTFASFSFTNEVHGGGGDDTFTLNASSLAPDPIIDGGAGDDTLVLSSAFTGQSFSHLTNIEKIVVTGGFDVDLTLSGTTNGSGALTIDTSGGLTIPSTTYKIDLTNDHSSGYHIIGSSAQDIVSLGNLHTGDTIDLGTNAFSLSQENDTVILDGDIGSLTGTLVSVNFTGVETLELKSSHNYGLSFLDSVVGAGGTFTIDGTALVDTGFVKLDATAELDGNYVIIFGDDLTTSVIKTGSGDDTITVGTDLNGSLIDGGDGDDTITIGSGAFASTINGGAGHDVLGIIGDYGDVRHTFASLGGVNFEGLKFGAGHSYVFSTADSDIASGATFDVDASALSGFEAADLDGSAETNASFHFILGAGFNYFKGGAGDDSFDYVTNTGGALNGGAGTNTVNIGGVVAGSSPMTFTNIQYIHFSADSSMAHSYDLAISGDVAGGGTVHIDVDAGGSNLANMTSLSLDMSGCTDDIDFHSVVNAPFGLSSQYNLVGGSGDDSFDFTFQFGTFTLSNFGSASTVDGGAGYDVLTLAGSGITCTDTTLLNIEEIDYLPTGAGLGLAVLTTADTTVAAGKTLLIKANGVSLTFDGSAETDGHFDIQDIGAISTVVGGALSDTFDAEGLTFTITGGGGGDDFTFNSGFHGGKLIYNSASESSSTNYDTLHNAFFGDVNNNGQLFQLTGLTVSGADAGVAGNLSTASFDSDLSGLVGAGQLGVHHALLFVATGGSLAGESFLIVDADGVAGYQAGQDYVFDVTGYTGTLSLANFVS